MTEHRKLVRDGIPAIIAADGRRPVVEVLSVSDYKRALLEKLHEEAAELARATDSSFLDELADVFEVLRALASDAGLTVEAVAAAADAKAADRGAFDDRLFLVRVEPAAT
ncbi:MAG TPA: nucleoside triphosphate pyrophosphohydrolase [Mycobacteriales bacterium]|nr:nucleoside triphosphate pyrophosphohydrolase [Mycobacteriales bacterium]